MVAFNKVFPFSWVITTLIHYILLDTNTYTHTYMRVHGLFQWEENILCWKVNEVVPFQISAPIMFSVFYIFQFLVLPSNEPYYCNQIVPFLLPWISLESNVSIKLHWLCKLEIMSQSSDFPSLLRMWSAHFFHGCFPHACRLVYICCIQLNALEWEGQDILCVNTMYYGT